jgi:hypothetical protein
MTSYEDYNLFLAYSTLAKAKGATILEEFGSRRGHLM